MKFKATLHLFIWSTKDSRVCILTPLTPSIFIRLFTRRIRTLFFNKVSIDTLFILVFHLSFGLLHIWYSLWPRIHLSSYFLQSISIFPVSGGCWRKVPPADQMVGNKEASSACSVAGDFEGDWPSRCTHRNTSVSQNNKSTVWLHPILRQ